jgi:hypothetical protein
VRRRTAAALLLLLVACVPTISDAPPELALLYEADTLTLTAPDPLVYVTLRLHGTVKSRYCTLARCKPSADGWVYLRLSPESGPYPPPLPLATGRFTNIEALLLLVGERETRRLHWP